MKQQLMSITRSLSLAALISCTLSLAFTSSGNAQPTQPKARVNNVTDEYFGVKVTDPYRWMEDLQARETIDWIKGQADYARAYLDHLPLRNQILQELKN